MAAKAECHAGHALENAAWAPMRAGLAQWLPTTCLPYVCSQPAGAPGPKAWEQLELLQARQL